jgi:hypothetical protein
MALSALLIFLLNTLSGIVAFLTSYYAYRFGRIAESPLLRAITLGFMLLGAGLFLEAATSITLGRTLVDATEFRTLAAIMTFSYLSIQMTAYLVFAIGYGYLAFGKPSRGVAVSAAVIVGVKAFALEGLHRYAVVSYFVALLFLAFIVFQGVLIHSRSRNRFSLWVLTAFSLVLGAHLFLLGAVVVLSSGLFLVGAVVQFTGFVSLLVFLLRSGRIGAG